MSDHTFADVLKKMEDKNISLRTDTEYQAIDGVFVYSTEVSLNCPVITEQHELHSEKLASIGGYILPGEHFFEKGKTSFQRFCDCENVDLRDAAKALKTADGRLCDDVAGNLNVSPNEGLRNFVCIFPIAEAKTAEDFGMLLRLKPCFFEMLPLYVEGVISILVSKDEENILKPELFEENGWFSKKIDDSMTLYYTVTDSFPDV